MNTETKDSNPCTANRTRTTNRRIVKWVVVVAWWLTAGASIWGSPAQAAVGISPVTLDFNDALRGGTFVQTLQLSNESSSDPGAIAGDSKLLRFTVKAQGETAPWVHFLGQEDPVEKSFFEVAKNERVIVRVKVDVPPDTPNKQYKGSIFIEALTVDAEASVDSGTNVASAADIPLTVNVGGTQRRSASVEDYNVDIAEVGMKQRFSAKIRNLGNVSVAAQLNVTLSRAGAKVATLSSVGQNFPVFPEQDGSVHLEWDTVEQRSGDYNARLTVLDVSGSAPVSLGTKDVDFRLEPRGTFTRSGQFTDFVAKNLPEKGGLAVAEARFLNTGKIATNAVFDGGISLNGKLIKSVRSLPRSVRPGETGSIDVTFDALDSGSYEIVGKVNYDGEITGEKSLQMLVKPVAAAVAEKGSGGQESSLVRYVGFGAAVAALGLLALIVVRKRTPHGGVAT
jgi:hypothetical protein